MHWPVAAGILGNRIEYLDTWAGMALLMAKGKTRHLGVSNFAPEQLATLLRHTSHPPSVHQMELHPYLHQAEWLRWHAEHGIHVTAYSPLAGTNPTYQPGDPEPLLKNKVLTQIAGRHNATVAQVALAWGMGRGTSVIPKSAHTAYIEQNFGSRTLELTKEDREEIAEELGQVRQRYSNPGKGWKVPLFDGLEDSRGEHREHS